MTLKLYMINILSKYKSLSLIVVSILMSWIYFFSGLETHGLSLDDIYKISGDSSDYVESVESLIDGNDFTFFKTSDDKEFVSSHYENESYNKGLYYAFRSPGFAFFIAH